MYNNESAGPALDEFLDLLGQRVRLKGFIKYRAQLDNKSKNKQTRSQSENAHSSNLLTADTLLMFHSFLCFVFVFLFLFFVAVVVFLFLFVFFVFFRGVVLLSQYHSS